MPLSRDQELWGVALWVEKTHADAGWLFIAQQQDRLLAEGDLDGMTMWREVSRRYDELKAMTATQEATALPGAAPMFDAALGFQA